MDDKRDTRQAIERAASGGENLIYVNKKLDNAAISAKKERTEIEGREEFFKLRNIWSWFILIWISALIAFNSLLTILVGSKCLNFTYDAWFPRLITGETFLQIAGLGYIAVRFLFSDGK